jgi:hypothetical protein
MMVFWILFGVVAAILFLALARIKQNQELRILAVGLVVAALIYIYFAIGSSASKLWIEIEIVGVVFYGLLAVLGLRYSSWWLMLGWITHPFWDIELHLVSQGSAFTPAGYAIACASFDLLIAMYIAGVQLGILKLRKSNCDS